MGFWGFFFFSDREFLLGNRGFFLGCISRFRLSQTDRIVHSSREQLEEGHEEYLGR